MTVPSYPLGDPSASRLAESLLAFWADGGVDAMLLDEAVDRIEAGRILPPVRPAPAAPPPAAGRASAGQPDVSAAVAQAQALAAAAGDLDALVAAIAGFEGCPLRYEGAATQPVVYRGDPRAPLMVIGEGPGTDEDIQGQPFVGRAGKLLDRMLGAAGVSDRVLITNTVFWRPPGNRTPTPQETQICLPFVLRQIELVDPDILVCLGGPSAQTLLGIKDGITKTRGRWFTFNSGKREIRAMPTFHPAFLLRSPLQKRFAWRDFLAVKKALTE